MRARWPGWLGLLVGVAAHVYLSTTLAWPPLACGGEHGSLLGMLCLIVFTAPVWGALGGLLVLMTGWLRAGGNLMIIAGAPALAVLAGLAYLAAGIKAHVLYRGLGAG